MQKNMKKIFITGGAGFIGSHICEEIFNVFRNHKIIIFDKLTYAGNKIYIKNLLKSPRVKFVRGDINNYDSYQTLLRNVDLAINVAAESHVDNSFTNPISFSLALHQIKSKSNCLKIFTIWFNSS